MKRVVLTNAIMIRKEEFRKVISLITLQFSIHPMADNFIEIIKGALRGIDTSNVTMSTDDVATTMTGEQEAVFDAAKAMVIHASKSGVHIAFNGSFSAGCPSVSYEVDKAARQSIRINQKTFSSSLQYVSAKFALYPLGNPDYMDVIYKEIDQLKNSVVYNAKSEHGSSLHGDIHEVFKFFEDSFKNVYESLQSHLIMTVNMSINSPSHN
jgi:uncharacterized protein YqgV (UPF0045/DUF77 family)